MEDFLFEYPAQHEDVAGDQIYVDCIQHCRSWRQMQEASSKVTTAHECSHGAAAEIRIRSGSPYGILRISKGPQMEAPAGEPAIPRLIKPVAIPHAALHFMTFEGPATAGRFNAFYLTRNQAVKLPEPNCRKRDAVPFIPQGLREYRFQTYVTGQAEWDDMPLYLWDEWVAYVNGADACLDLVKRNEYTEGWRDIVFGILEFNIYSTAIMMAAHAKDPNTEKALLPFFQWHWKRAWNTFYAPELAQFAFPDQDRLLDRLKGDDGRAMRGYLENLGLTVPAGLLPDNSPLPDNLLI